MSKFKTIARYLLALFLIASGVNHVISPVFYLQSMPPYLPWPEPLIYISGFFAVVLGALLLVPRFSSLAAWGLIIWLIVVFPANVHMAANAGTGIGAVILWLRLPLQFVLIMWAYSYTKPQRGS